MKSIRLIAYVLVIATLTNCSKKDDDVTPAADSPAVITYTSPSTTAITQNGSALTIEGTILDNDGVASVKVEVKNPSNSVVYYTQTTTVANLLFYRFQWNWIVTGITAATVANIKVTTKDANGVEISKEINANLIN
jgi:hypothetical protein